MFLSQNVEDTENAALETVRAYGCRCKNMKPNELTNVRVSVTVEPLKKSRRL